MGKTERHGSAPETPAPLKKRRTTGETDTDLAESLTPPKTRKKSKSKKKKKHKSKKESKKRSKPDLAETIRKHDISTPSHRRYRK